MIYIFDNTFEGLLSAIFQTYSLKKAPVAFLRQGIDSFDDLFSETHHVTTNQEQVNRLSKGVIKRISEGALNRLYKVWLTEKETASLLIYNYIRYVFSNSTNIDTDFSNSHVLQVHQLAKQINREVHRMHAFVRFEHTKDDWFVASIQPDFNVMPLIGEYFERRYADQKWIIYDSKRHVGLYYDTVEMKCCEIISDKINKHGQLSSKIHSEEELKFQSLWKRYFHSVNIPERRNPKLHIRHIPKRYWKLMTEKRG